MLGTPINGRCEAFSSTVNTEKSLSKELPVSLHLDNAMSVLGEMSKCSCFGFGLCQRRLTIAPQG